MAVVRRHDDVFGVSSGPALSAAGLSSVSDVVSDFSSSMSNMAAVAVAVARENARRRIQQTSEHLTLSASSCSMLAFDHEHQERESCCSPFMLSDRQVGPYRLENETFVTHDDELDDHAAPVTPSSFAAVTVPSNASVSDGAEPEKCTDVSKDKQMGIDVYSKDKLHRAPYSDRTDTNFSASTHPPRQHRAAADPNQGPKSESACRHWVDQEVRKQGRMNDRRKSATTGDHESYGDTVKLSGMRMLNQWEWARKSAVGNGRVSSLPLWFDSGMEKPLASSINHWTWKPPKRECWGKEAWEVSEKEKLYHSCVAFVYDKVYC